MQPRARPGRQVPNRTSQCRYRGLACTLSLLALGLTSCVETYDDTRIQANLWVGSQFDKAALVLPTPGLRPGDPGYFSHYELFATIEGVGMVRLLSFIIQPAIHKDNPCLQYIPDIYCVDVPGSPPCQPYQNMERWAAMERIYTLVSAQVTLPVPPGFSAYGYDHYPAYDFVRWPDEVFLDPTLTPDASKLHRDNLRQEVVENLCSYCLPENYYLGDPTQLSSPKHGEIYGIVDGPDPRSGVGIGGIYLRLPGKIFKMTELLVTRERDTSRLSAQNYYRTDLLPSDDSVVFLVGRKDKSMGAIHDRQVWGVTTVDMVNPYGLTVYMHAVVFGEIDRDPVGI